MEHNCSTHISQGATIYCKDHLILCCEQCKAIHQNHNTATIAIFSKSSLSVQKYFLLKKVVQTLQLTKTQVASIFDETLTRIGESITTLEQKCDLQILTQLETQAKMKPSDDYISKITDIRTQLQQLCEKLEISPNNDEDNSKIFMDNVNNAISNESLVKKFTDRELKWVDEYFVSHNNCYLEGKCKSWNMEDMYYSFKFYGQDKIPNPSTDPQGYGKLMEEYPDWCIKCCESRKIIDEKQVSKLCIVCQNPGKRGPGCHFRCTTVFCMEHMQMYSLLCENGYCLVCKHKVIPE